MRLFKVLTGAWKSITLDFIVKLPLSKEIFTGIIYDLILVIIDRLIKYAYFIPYKEELTVEELVYIFNRNIIIIISSFTQSNHFLVYKGNSR
jgi:hypothetical protein